MKKLLLLTAVGLVMQAAPVFAEEGVGGNAVPPHKKEHMKKHDTNGDGVISKDEFLSFAEERFGKMDTNGDGTITKDEAQAAHKGKKEKMEEMREKFKEKRQERMEKREAESAE